MMERIKAVGRALLTSKGRDTLRVATGEKALNYTVLHELIGGSTWFQGLPLSKLGDFETYLKAGAKQVWVLWKCADIKAGVAMSTPWKLVKKNRRGDESEFVSPEFTKITEEPNGWQTFGDLIYETFMHLYLTGNCFWVKDRQNLLGGQPGELRILNPKRVSILVSIESGVYGYVYRPVYMENMADITKTWIPIAPEEMIHIRCPNPDNDFWGLGEVESAEPLFNDWINEGTWRERFWQRGGTPTTLLMLKGSFPGGPEKFREFKKSWEQEYGGVDNAGKVSWLTGEWEKQSMGLTLEEMQSIEQRRFAAEQIAMQCGVPLSILGMENAANYATAAVSDTQFRRYTMKPAMMRVAAALTKGLVRGYDSEAYFKFDLRGLVNVDEISAVWTPLLDRAVITPNELRELVEMERVDDPSMDLHYITAGLTPLDTSGVADLGMADMAARETARRFVEGAGRPRNGGNGGNGGGNGRQLYERGATE